MKLGLISDQVFDTLHQEALIAMQLPSFSGIVHITMIIRQKPKQ
jgi:hypothetical protein